MRIDEKIFTTRFACNLQACKGACCTFPGGAGPPVSASELPMLERAFDLVKHVLPVQHRRLVELDGLCAYENASMTIRCYDDRACVFVVYDQGIALCSIQQAWQRGDFPWPKPLSCHLFPIRIKGKHRDHLRFERFSECDPAFDEGDSQGIPLVDFLSQPLIRALGEAGFLELKQRSNNLLDVGGNT